MRIELMIATGDELLNGVIVDSNSPWLMERLAARGLPVARKVMVRDDRSAIVGALRTASQESELVIVSGGLGPTADDLTAECAAEAAGQSLALHQPTLDALTARMLKRGLTVSENNRRQAMVPLGAQVIANRFGTAPMFEMAIGRGRFFFLPGVPRELMGLCEEELFPRLAGLAADAPLRRVRYLRCYGIAESMLDQRLGDLPKSFPALTLSYRTTLPENHVGLTVTGRNAAEVDEQLQAATAQARERIGAACFRGRWPELCRCPRRCASARQRHRRHGRVADRRSVRGASGGSPRREPRPQGVARGVHRAGQGRSARSSGELAGATWRGE